MKTKFDLEKYIIACIFSFCICSLIMTGCGKDYGPDINSLRKKTSTHDSILQDMEFRVKALESGINNVRNELNAKIDQIRTITSIQTIEEGVGGYRIEFNIGNPIELRNGADGTTWSIGDPAGLHHNVYDSMWYKNGQYTDYRAIPRPGINGADGVPIPVRSPGISSDGYWMTYEWNASTSLFDSTKTTYQASSNLISYVTETSTDWVFHLRDGAAGMTFREVSLPKSGGAAGGGFISLLGHFPHASPNSPLSAGTLDASPDLRIDFWYLDSLYNAAEQAKLTVPWVGRKTVQPAGQVLTTLARDTVAFVISSNLTFTASSAFKFWNSQGDTLPLSFGTPVPFTSILTKSAHISGAPLYLLPVNVSGQTFAGATAFAGRFTNNAIYYLGNEGGITSNYSSFSVTLADSSARIISPAALASVGSTAFTGITDTIDISVNTPYPMGFNAVNHLYDYRVVKSI
ncbi:MAG: DUF4988 domain-containing protein, partial [Tannerella sp.]|nr:DUF4988 domain-containing protein [Tannerella sp.]